VKLKMLQNQKRNQVKKKKVMDQLKLQRMQFKLLKHLQTNSNLQEKEPPGKILIWVMERQLMINITSNKQHLVKKTLTQMKKRRKMKRTKPQKC